MSNDTAVFRNGAVINGLKIVGRLGAGGMGSVFKAYDPALDRHVAIKVLAPAMQGDPVCVERFQREARVIASLRHPNLMHIYTVGEEQGLHYFVMEYIEGMPLNTMLTERKRPFAVKQAISLAEQILDALHKVHCAGIVHRDLKPGNIMIDSDGRAILVDFGLSKNEESNSLTSTGVLLGTPDYMAPEQIEDDPVGAYTDIYALGVVLYEMLTKSQPFHRKSAIQTMRAHCEEAPPSLVTVRQDIPAVLEGVLTKAMARDYHERYPDAPTFAAALLTVARTSRLAKLARHASATANADTRVGLGASNATILSQPTASISASKSKRTSVSNASVNSSVMGVTQQEKSWVYFARLAAAAAVGALIMFLFLAVWAKYKGPMRRQGNQRNGQIESTPTENDPSDALIDVPGDAIGLADHDTLTDTEEPLEDKNAEDDKKKDEVETIVESRVIALKNGKRGRIRVYTIPGSTDYTLRLHVGQRQIPDVRLSVNNRGQYRPVAGRRAFAKLSIEDRLYVRRAIDLINTK